MRVCVRRCASELVCVWVLASGVWRNVQDEARLHEHLLCVPGGIVQKDGQRGGWGVGSVVLRPIASPQLPGENLTVPHEVGHSCRQASHICVYVCVCGENQFAIGTTNQLPSKNVE